jgi:transcriptional regulator with XRE-family HTH domain
MGAYQLRRRYYLHADKIREIIDAKSLTISEAANQLGISRQHLSNILAHRQTLCPTMRRRFLNCELFAGLREDELWVRLEPGEEPSPEVVKRAPRRPRMRLPFPVKRYLLTRAATMFAADSAGLTLAELGTQLGLSEGYWFPISAGSIPVGQRLRTIIEQHPAFAGIPRDQLWVVAEIPCDPRAIQPVSTEVTP